MTKKSFYEWVKQENDDAAGDSVDASTENYPECFERFSIFQDLVLNVSPEISFPDEETEKNFREKIEAHVAQCQKMLGDENITKDDEDMAKLTLVDLIAEINEFATPEP